MTLLQLDGKIISMLIESNNSLQTWPQNQLTKLLNFYKTPLPLQELKDL